MNIQRPYCVNKRVGVLAGDQVIYDLIDFDAEDTTMMINDKCLCRLIVKSIKEQKKITISDRGLS